MRGHRTLGIVGFVVIAMLVVACGGERRSTAGHITPLPDEPVPTPSGLSVDLSDRGLELYTKSAAFGSPVKAAIGGWGSNTSVEVYLATQEQYDEGLFLTKRDGLVSLGELEPRADEILLFKFTLDDEYTTLGESALHLVAGERIYVAAFQGNGNGTGSTIRARPLRIE